MKFYGNGKSSKLLFFHVFGTNKFTHCNDAPTKIIKANDIVFVAFFYLAYNESVISGTFPLVFKLVDVKQIHKKNGRLEKSNYKPPS